MSVTFGVVPVGADTVLSDKTVIVRNTGTGPVTYATSFAGATTAGGATFTTAPGSLTVPAGGSGLVLTPYSEPALRVPVQAAPQLVSDLTVQPVALANASTLTATSAKLEDSALATSPSSVKAGDLRYVGFFSTSSQLAAAGLDARDGAMALGIATDGDWASLGTAVLPIIDTDLNGDGAPELETPVNGFFGDVDTTVFDNNVLVVPLGLAALAIVPGVTPTSRMPRHIGSTGPSAARCGLPARRVRA